MKSLRRSGSRPPRGPPQVRRARRRRTSARSAPRSPRRPASAYARACAAGVVVLAQDAARRRAALALGDDARRRRRSTQRRREGVAARRDAAAAVARASASGRCVSRGPRRSRRVAATIVSQQVRRGHAVGCLRRRDSTARTSVSSTRRGAAAVDRLGGHRDARRGIVAARPAMSSDAPAFSSTMSRGAPVAPASTRGRSRALSAAIAAAQRLPAPPCAADVGGMQVERVDRAVAALRDLRVAGGRDLVEAVGAVHDPGALGAELRQRSRDQLGQLRPRHADQLPRRRRPDWSAARAG